MRLTAAQLSALLAWPLRMLFISVCEVELGAHPFLTGQAA